VPSGWTSKPLDCAFCGDPLSVPRPVHRLAHEECATALALRRRREKEGRYKDNPTWLVKERARGRDKQRRLRQAALGAYGGACTCCGEATYEWLTIDHVNGDGAEHRREIGRGNLYRWLKRHDYPDGFRVLCWNCNCARGYYGFCPHEERR